MRKGAWSRTILGLGVLACLAGCASTRSSLREETAERERLKRWDRQDAAFARLQSMEEAVWEVMAPMMREAGRYNAREAHGYVGASFVTEAFYGDEQRRSARRAGFGPFVVAVAVQPGSPAALAGLRAGDQLLRVNGKRVPRWRLGAQYAAVRLKRALRPGETNELVVQRGPERLVLSIVPEKAAYYATVVSPELAEDLRLDGEMIWMSERLATEAHDKGELAYVGAYAVAQSVMRHPEKRRRNRMVGGALDAAALSTGVFTIGALSATGQHSKGAEFAAEADLIALYLLAATGQDYPGYIEFWRRELTRQAAYGRLGPAAQARLEAMQETVEAIEAKRAAGRFLFPEEYLTLAGI